MCFFVSCIGDLRDLHVRTHSVPTRRSSDLAERIRPVPNHRGVHRIRGLDRLAGADRLADERIEALAQFGFSIVCHVVVLSVRRPRSEEHTSELQSLMRLSYAVFCLKKKKNYRCKPTTLYNNTTTRIP